MKRYGVLGIVLIILVELNFFFKIQPFANWYFPLIWFGYILLVDSVVYSLKGRSLINNRPWRFMGILILSALFWYSFEFFNLAVKNWSYVRLAGDTGFFHSKFHRTLAFSTVLPALFETTELILSLKLFDKFKLRKKHKISKSLIYSMIVIGVACFFLPLIFPSFAFPLVWLSFFLILDPINYLNKQPSIIGHLKDRKLKIPLSLLLAGFVIGFLWEFWNYYAVLKWTYELPFFNWFKIFEMPVLGYLGYFPFSFELYAMYWFCVGLFNGKEKQLI